MARITIGNRDGTLAIRHGRTVLERLVEEWPDLQLTAKTVASGGPDQSGEASRLLAALTRNAIDVAVINLATLTEALPAELTLAAVLRRHDPRSAVVAKGYPDLASLPAGAVVGVDSERDAAFLAATHPGLTTRLLTQHPEAELAKLPTGDYAAIILPAATLIGLDMRDHVDEWLEQEVYTPAAGQGAVGLVVRADDDLAFETVYPLQHRPSFDRVRAERAFSLALDGHRVGAAATVTDDGELTLLGAVASGSTVIQGSVGGEAKEADELGKELATDFAERLQAL